MSAGSPLVPANHERRIRELELRALRPLLAFALWLEAFGFAFASFLHTGARLEFLPRFFQDPRIVGATVVEGLCALLLAAAAQVTNSAPAAWSMAVGAEVFSICADIFGMVLIGLGLGPDSPFNFLFHRIGIAVLLLVLVALLTAPGKAALRPQPADRSAQSSSPVISGRQT